jgi:Tat protein secretion system quality control protein TatD with DNase activity
MYISNCNFSQINVPKNWPIHLHRFTDSWADCQDLINEWSEMKFGLCPDFFVADVAENIPLDKLLLETDSPFIIPSKVS